MKKLIKICFNPSLVFSICYSIIELTVSIVTVFLLDRKHPNIILSYTLMTISIALFPYFVFLIVYGIINLSYRIKDLLDYHFYGTNYFKDYTSTTILFSLLSLIINVAFTVMNAFNAGMTKSYYYMIMALFYFSLICIRGIILISRNHLYKKYKDNKTLKNHALNRLYTIFSYIFFAYQLILISTIYISLREQAFHSTSIIIAISTATFTVYKVISSFINIIKSFRTKDVLVISLRNIKIIEALVSLFLLSCTLVTLGDADLNWQYRLIGLTGFVVFILNLSLTITLIIHSHIKLYKEQEKFLKIENII